MAITALTIIAFSFNVSAQQAEFRKTDFKEGKHKQRFEQLKQELNLTPQQQEQMKEIHKDIKEQVKPLHEQLKANREKIRELSASGQANQRAINNLIDESASLKAKMQKLHFEGRLKVKSVLTPEQAQKFEELMPFPPEKKGRHGEFDRPNRNGERKGQQPNGKRGF